MYLYEILIAPNFQLTLFSSKSAVIGAHHNLSLCRSHRSSYCQCCDDQLQRLLTSQTRRSRRKHALVTRLLQFAWSHVSLLCDRLQLLKNSQRFLVKTSINFNRQKFAEFLCRLIVFMSMPDRFPQSILLEGLNRPVYDIMMSLTDSLSVENMNISL
jgi:hypothetical protein